MGGCVSSDKDPTSKPTTIHEPADKPRAFGADLSNKHSKPLKKGRDGLQAQAARPANAKPLQLYQPANATMQHIDLSTPAKPATPAHHKANPQMVTSYINDIVAHYRRVEGNFTPSRYIESGMQSQLSPRGRGVVINWISEVHRKFRLKHETLFLSANILDRFLSVRNVSKPKMQLVGACAVWVAAKWEEIYPPHLDDLVRAAGKNVFSRNELIKMEVTMLNAIKFDIGVPTLFPFVKRYLLCSDANDKVSELSWFLAELSLHDYDMQQHKPSIISAACVRLARMMLHHDQYNETRLKADTGYSDAEIAFCVQAINALVREASKDSTACKSVVKKYSLAERFQVATVPALDMQLQL